MPVPVVTAAAMRDWEKSVFGQGTADERVVMESAGRAVAAAVAERFPDGRVIGVLGAGNNGGDAVVALRSLMAAGREVVAVPVGDAGVPARLAHGWAIPVGGVDALDSADVLIDGILGTGATGAPREPHAGMIRAMNAARAPIVAIDGPSGVDLTTGAVAGEAILAAATVTFGAVKRGLLLYPGRIHAGRILLAEVGFPPLAVPDQAEAVTDGWARERLPAIPPDAHKGAVGLVGVVAGRAGYGGAALMVTMGALRAGAGGVRVFSVDANRAVINSAVPEAVFFERTAAEARDALRGTRAVVIGPGIGTDPSARAVLESVLDGFPGSFVIDADAVTLIAGEPGILSPTVAARCVLTPHPGELARLLGVDTATVLADRFASAAAAAERFGCLVLAKGAPSLVAAPGLPTLIAVSGHSGIATGGMGDTLGGIIGAFLAAGATPRIAAGLGIHFAGRAAEAAGRGRGLLPRDVAEALPGVLAGGSRERAPTWPFTFDLPPAR